MNNGQIMSIHIFQPKLLPTQVIKSPHNIHNRNHLTQHLYDAQQRWLKFTNIMLWVISFSVHLQLMRFVQGGRSFSIISLDDSVIIITKVCAYV